MPSTKSGTEGYTRTRRVEPLRGNSRETLRNWLRRGLCEAYAGSTEKGGDGIDKEFVPFLERLNKLPYAAPVQCCIGHMFGKKAVRARRLKLSPELIPKRFGYLEVCLTADACTYLHRHVLCGQHDWLWVYGSRLFLEKAREPESTLEAFRHMTEGWVVIAFAWDACHWPRPAEVITQALEAFHALATTNMATVQST